MSTILQVSRGQGMIAWPSLLLTMLMTLQDGAAAHDLFTGYVQHNVLLTVSARHIDIELDLTFFEQWSACERTAMDSDSNGRITRSEIELYVKQLAPELTRQVTLRVSGQELPLIPLYAPEIDLLGHDKIGPAHHRLRLFFFVPTPEFVRAGAEIIVEDRLWPAAKALGVLDSKGCDGCRLEKVDYSDPGLDSARPGEARLFRIRCVRPPRERTPTPVISSLNANQTSSQTPSANPAPPPQNQSSP